MRTIRATALAALACDFSAFGQIIDGIEVFEAFEKEEVAGEKLKRRLEIIEASLD